MHKIYSAVTTGSVGDLGRIARALADAGFDIAAVGGGEGMVRGHEVGIMSFLIRDDDTDDGTIIEIIRNVPLADNRQIESAEELWALAVELEDQPGRLADAAEVLGTNSINILGVLLIDLHGSKAHVGLGFVDEDARNTAKGVLEGSGFTVFDDHDDT